MHKLTCPAYGNYQPPYNDCTCGNEKDELTTEELITLKHHLDEASDKLTKRIIKFEEDLKKLSLGVECWIDLSKDTSIGYQKYNSEWQIIIQYHDFETIKKVPLKEAKRGLRLYGWRNIDKILPALESAAKSLLDRINEALEKDKVYDKS